MQRTFSYILLITWIILIGGCKTNYVNTRVESSNLVVSDSLAEMDNQVVNTYLPYKKELEKDMSTVISVADKEMVKGKPESALTNFLADLLLGEAKTISDTLGLEIVPHISYFNHGGIRTFLPRGNITVGKVYELMPFENQLVYLKLSGKQVQEFLNISAEKGGDSLGGVRFVISGKQAKNAVIGGEPLDEQSNYWLVTNDYVASGGDDMELLTQNIEKVSGNVKIRDIIISHLDKLYQRGDTISVETDGRIRYE